MNAASQATSNRPSTFCTGQLIIMTRTKNTQTVQHKEGNVRLDCQGDPGITFFTVPLGFDIAPGFGSRFRPLLSDQDRIFVNHAHSHTHTHDENRKTRTKQRKAVGDTPQKLQSSPHTHTHTHTHLCMFVPTSKPLMSTRVW